MGYFRIDFWRWKQGHRNPGSRREANRSCISRAWDCWAKFSWRAFQILCAWVRSITWARISWAWGFERRCKGRWSLSNWPAADLCRATLAGFGFETLTDPSAYFWREIEAGALYLLFWSSSGSINKAKQLLTANQRKLELPENEMGAVEFDSHQVWDILHSLLKNQKMKQMDLTLDKICSNVETWGREGFASISKRLDRAYCNLEWREWFPEASVRHLPKTRSDHFPVLIDLMGCSPPIKKPFRFEAAWLKHDGFLPFLKQVWQPLKFALPHAREKFTGEVNLWNQEVFGNIFYRKKRLRARLAGIQRALCLSLESFSG